jgi:hypothetical protein
VARRIKPSPQLELLKSLAGDPERQQDLAINIVEAGKDLRALRAALDVLKQRPAPSARQALIERYEHLAADGIRRDSGGTLRAAILEALRHIARPEDVALVERAASTYEFLPPARSEETWQLRAAALVVLNELDSLRAAYHAVRLLADQHTSRQSGEPAVTAARVLLAQDNRLPLYYYALHQNQPPPVSDVVAECLRGLAGLPAELVVPLVDRYRAADDDIVLVGLLDMALEYGGAGFEIELVRDLLRPPAARDQGGTRSLAIYRYVLTRIVSSHNPVHLPELGRHAESEQDPKRLAILDEVLALGRPDPVIQEAQAAVKKKPHRP